MAIVKAAQAILKVSEVNSSNPSAKSASVGCTVTRWYSSSHTSCLWQTALRRRLGCAVTFWTLSVVHAQQVVTKWLDIFVITMQGVFSSLILFPAASILPSFSVVFLMVFAVVIATWRPQLMCTSARRLSSVLLAVSASHLVDGSTFHLCTLCRRKPSVQRRNLRG